MTFLIQNFIRAIVCLDDRTGQKIIKDFVFQLQDQAERCGFDIDNPKKAYSANRAQEVIFVFYELTYILMRN